MMWLGITIVCVFAVLGGLKVKRRWLARNRRLEREAIEATLDAMDADTRDQPSTRVNLSRDTTLDRDRPPTPAPTDAADRPQSSPQAVTPTTAPISPQPTEAAIAPASPKTANSANEYQYLENLLKEQRYEEADRVTWQIVLQLAGVEGRGYLELDELMLLPRLELIHLDQLWQHHSQGHWGFGVQRRLFEQAESDYSKLGKVTGWMIDGTWLQPQNTIYDLEQSPPGHFPQEIWRNIFSVFDAFGLSLGIETLLAHEAFDPSSTAEIPDRPAGVTPAAE
jgi:hypothetical protein